MKIINLEMNVSINRTDNGSYEVVVSGNDKSFNSIVRPYGSSLKPLVRGFEEALTKMVESYDNNNIEVNTEAGTV